MKRDNKGRFCKSQKGTEMKHIKLGKPYIEGRKIKVVIEEQSHRESSFGTKVGATGDLCKKFVASNRVVLYSVAGPEVKGTYIFVRGSNEDMDNLPRVFDSLEDYLKFEDSVREYNEYFSKPQVKEVTMEELHNLLGYEVKIKKGN